MRCSFILFISYKFLQTRFVIFPHFCGPDFFSIPFFKDTTFYFAIGVTTASQE